MTAPVDAASLPAQVVAEPSWPVALRALRYRSFRLLVVGQFISLVGTWMATTTTLWLAYRLTRSPLVLGFVVFGTQAPALLLGPVSGLIADRVNRRHLLICTQLAFMLTSLVLATAASTTTLSPQWLVAASLVQGTIAALDMPCRSAFLLSLIDKREDIVNAVALSAITANGTRMIGAATGGVIIAGVGEAWCYGIDAVTYLAPLAILLHLKIDTVGETRPEAKRLLQQLADGWSSLIASPLVRPIAALLAMFTLFGVPYTVLMPVIVTDVLQRGPDVLGRIYSASAGGAVLGSLALTQCRRTTVLPGTMAIASMVFGGCMIAFASSQTTWLSMTIAALSGCCSVLQLASSNTVLQTIAAPEMRGRVASCFFMATVGVAPAGALAAGLVSSSIGAAPTLAVCGVCCVATAIAFALRIGPIREALASAVA